jgi:hypothetical protein
MAADDWAIIVGVQVYPGLNELAGPENDARAFAEWTCTPDGGGVPADDYVRQLTSRKVPPGQGLPSSPFEKGQVALILSSQFTPPMFQSVDAAQPTATHVVAAFKRLKANSDQRLRAGQGRQVGRRLYLFFAGHGIQPALPPDPKAHDVLVLMADADVEAVNNHFTATQWAEWFWRAGLFEEVILFMDCCREPTLTASPVPVAYKPINSPGKHMMFAYAMPSKKNYETMMPDGQVHGVLTWALLQGLRGHALPPGKTDGRLTAGDLDGWMYENMKHYLPPAARADPRISQEPQFRYGSTGDREMVLVQLPEVPRFQVIIRVPAGLQGSAMRVEDGALAIVVRNDGAGATWVVRLPRGRYAVVVPSAGVDHPFTLGGSGDVDVQL